MIARLKSNPALCLALVVIAWSLACVAMGLWVGR